MTNLMKTLVARFIDYGSAEYHASVDLRDSVLRKPLGLKFDPADLALEIKDLHVGAFCEGRIVGCMILVRASPTSLKVRQVAVAPETQGAGIGKAMVVFAESYARSVGISEIVLNARDTAVPFYLKQGYETSGSPFIEVTILHQKMCKRL